MAKRKSQPIRMCVDRIIPPEHKIAAAAVARAANPKNVPHVPRGLGLSFSPLRMAILTPKKWPNGTVLGVRFMDGSPTQKGKVIDHANEWSQYANIKFNFSAGSAAEIRVSFQADPGSWSAVGTDCLYTQYFPKSEPTMNFGWLTDTTDDTEYNRVVVHEFGHAIGAIHEHQNPKGGIKWNTAAVYKYFAGPPNYWSKAETKHNVIDKYAFDQLNASTFDPDSIMLYQFPAALIKGGKATKENTDLSTGDIAFIKTMYPK